MITSDRSYFADLFVMFEENMPNSSLGPKQNAFQLWAQKNQFLPHHQGAEVCYSSINALKLTT